MSKELAGSKDYINWLGEIKSKIRSARQRAILKVNHELLSLYWSIGESLASKESDWGNKFIDNLARDLKVEFPDEKGFSKRNLENMRRWYKYHQSNHQIAQQLVAQLGNNAKNQFTQQVVAQLGKEEKDKLVQQLAAQLPNELSQQAADQLVYGLLYSIPWGHHTLILTKTNSPEEVYFYIIETIRNNWSRSVLQLQIEDNQFEKQGSKINNFDLTLPDANKDLVRETLKSEYNLGFLGLESDIQEKELEKALTQHIRKFLIALGKGFSYVGNQHNIRIADDDYFLDMLFFNINLNCYVVVELKIGDFKPEFAGKLNFYTNAVDKVAKLPHHNPTIGILLCKTTNIDVIKLSLKGVNSPLGVADYKLTKELKSGLPTKKELEQSLHTEIEIPKDPIDEKLSKLKDLIAKAGQEKVKLKRTKETITDVIKNVFFPISVRIKKITDKKIAPLFHENSITYYYDSSGTTQKAFQDKLKEKSNSPSQVHINFRFEGLIEAGTKSFNASFDLYIEFQQRKYVIYYGHKPNKVEVEKLYHQFMTTEQQTKFVEEIIAFFIDEITSYAKTNLK